MNRIATLIGAAITWFGIILQYLLILQNGDSTPLVNTIQFLSFFTILSNILVGLYYIFASFDFESGLRQFFMRPMVIAAITTYIAIVGLTYNIILRSLWSPQGWQKVADETLHLITPVLFIIYWLTLADKKNLNWKGALSWMIFPLMYFIYTLVRGEVTGRYPYPFLDVTQLGYPTALTNCLFVTLAFFAVAALVVAVGRALEQNRASKLILK